MKCSLLDRETLLAQAEILVRKEPFTHEDNARCNALMTLAERMGPSNGKTALDSDTPEARDFRNFLRMGIMTKDRQVRDMTEGTGADGGYMVPEGFRQDLAVTMQAYDALLSPDVCTIYEPEKGNPVNLPIIDDTTSAAVKVSETIQSEIQLPKVDRVSLGLAPTYRSGIVPMSVELAQDSAFDPVDFLGRALGIRMARGIAPDLVSTLLSAAQQGAVAQGDPNLTGATAANSIGYADLLALRRSVNPAYRAVGAYWLLNDDTLTVIDGWLDKNGRPLIHPQYNANGRRTLLGFPVALCPSMPDIGSGKAPVAFGSTQYFVIRIVKNVTRVQRLVELYAEYGIVAFQSYMRVDGALLCVSGGSPASSDTPVKFLSNAS